MKLHQRQKLVKEDGETIRGGKPLISKLKNLGDGEWDIRIYEWKDDRTLRQNATMWMWIDIIAEETGYRSKDELYDALIDMYAPTYTYKALDGKPKRKKLTTSRMNIQQMSDFMDAIQQQAAELNIKLPQPEEQ